MSNGFYNANGIRVASIVNGEETRYLVDATRMYPQVLEEYNSDGQTLASYTYGASLLSQYRNGTSAFYLSDGHSGIRQLSNSTGLVTNTYSYDGYGRLLSSTENAENSYQYRGEQFDSNLGLQYLRARYYDPDSGRFFGVDPLEGSLEQPMSRHRYMYGNNNPLMYADPSGEIAGLAQFASESAVTTVQNTMATLGRVVMGSKVLKIATGLAAGAAAITGAIALYSAWRTRTGGEVLWTGTFDLTKIPSPVSAPSGTPSVAVGLANLGSPSLEMPQDRARVAAAGFSYTPFDLVPALNRTPSSSTYNVTLWTPDLGQVTGNEQATSRGAFLGPFIFSTLRFTWPYIMPDNVWTGVDETDGAIALGFGTGWASKATNLRYPRTDPRDWERYDPFEFGFAVGGSAPIG